MKEDIASILFMIRLIFLAICCFGALIVGLIIGR